MKSFARTFLGLIALAFVLAAGAQVVPVQPSTGVGSGPLWLWIAITIAVAALVYLYIKKHGEAASAKAVAGAGKDAAQALTRALADAHKALDNLTKPGAAPAATAPPAAGMGPPSAPAAVAAVVAPPVFVAAPVAAPTAPAIPRPPTAPAPAVAAADPPAPVPVARNPLSNAPAGFPDTSPGGYPLWYPLALDGKPAGAAVVLYDGQTFANDSLIAAYQASVARRNLNLAAYTSPAFVGAVPMSTLTPDDWCYIDSQPGVLWNAVLAGDADVFNANTVHFYYNGLASFNPSTYAGPLKQS